jgi:hypothetical protein
MAIAEDQKVVSNPYLAKLDTLSIPWTESPFFEQLLERERARFTSDEIQQLRFFSENGYLIFDPKVPNELLSGAIEELEGKHALDQHGKEVRLQDGWAQSPSVKQIATWPDVLATLQMLYQRAPIPFQTLNFVYGTQQRTHSDTIHFQSYPNNFMCGVWVALEAVDADNGPLHYYPGSQKLPLYDTSTFHGKTGLANYKHYEDFIEAITSMGKFKRETVRMQKGEAIIWSANLLHGGERINDPSRTRHSQVTHYYFENCMYYTPLASDPFMKEIFFRHEGLIDVRTGVPIQQYHKGRPVAFSFPPPPPPPHVPLYRRALRRLKRMVKGAVAPAQPRISQVQPEDMQPKMMDMMMAEHRMAAPVADLMVRYTDESS